MFILPVAILLVAAAFVLVINPDMSFTIGGSSIKGSEVGDTPQQPLTDAAGKEAESQAPEAQAQLNEGVLVGKVLDSITNQPIVGALVTDGKNVVTTGPDGSYRLDNIAAANQIKIRVHGYDRAAFDPSKERPAEVKLRPRNIRALYLTYYGVGDEDIFAHAMQVIKETEANALVIDVKGDRGWLAYKSSVPMVEAIGAQREDYQIKDVHALIDMLKKENVYTIARIVTFKDNPLARARPDLAVHDGRNGGLWIDGEGLAWTDPFKEEVWDYNIALAVEAANLGFDEIQFDYVRFPTDPSAGTSVDATVFSDENLMANRVAAITGFLKKADEALKPTGVALAADIFGYVTWRTDDMGIGQHLETLGGMVDYICPMVYPTLYWDGIPRMDGGDPYVNDAPAHPYDIVHLSLKQAEGRLQGARAKLRPWLQYYNDYILDIPYGAHEIELQKQATYDMNIDSWMMWDPSNRYAKGGFAAGQ
ncbi:MAG: putative glycoside hydrolase [Chloroflexota bacterium]